MRRSKFAMPLPLILIACAATLCGCRRTAIVFVNSDPSAPTMMRLLEPVKARVAADWDGDGVETASDGRVTIPAGHEVWPPLPAEARPESRPDVVPAGPNQGVKR